MTTFTKDTLPQIAESILKKASSLNTDSAAIIELVGDLGAGKTTTTQEVARILGIIENIISPTFVIMKIYQLKNSTYQWKKLIHIDAYRLKDKEELWKLGWKEIEEDKDNLVIIEWPENVEGYTENKVMKIELKHKLKEEREIWGL